MSAGIHPVRLTCVVGARPNFVKMAAVLEAAVGRPNFCTRLVHTGQHFSPEMSETFFGELDLPQPDVNLGVRGGSQSRQTAEIMKQLDEEISRHPADLVLVVGDVNSTVAAALVAAKAVVPLAHVEAGLRSFDRSMPEEINRVVTDVLADYLFVSEPAGLENLKAEGIAESRIFFVGNVMIDTLLRFLGKAEASDVLMRLGLPNQYGVLTLHRPSNVDDPTRLKALIEALETAAERLPIVFPAHPRTQASIREHQINLKRVRLIEPLGYLDFLRLQSQATLVLTDSGGIQEETTILRVPCLTLRDNTERPVTIEQGTNRLVGTKPTKILAAFHETLDGPSREQPFPELWDGKAAERVLDVLERVCP